MEDVEVCLVMHAGFIDYVARKPSAGLRLEAVYTVVGDGSLQHITNRCFVPHVV